MNAFSERGNGASPLAEALQATSCVVRDDRNGSSRYRASKMSGFSDKLGWYREYIFLAPNLGGEVYFLEVEFL